MTTYFKDKKNLAIAGIILVIIILAIGTILIFKNNKLNLGGQTKTNSAPVQPQIINDTVSIPTTTSIVPTEGESVPRGDYNIKIQPQTPAEQVIVVKAKYTIKQAYDASINLATTWAPDAKLVFIKSNGAINLEGRSSSWQVVYGSKLKKSGYEIIFQEDQAVSQKEIESTVYGYKLPNNWYDSNEAIASLSLPQFKDDTISSISFYYNTSAESWSYGLATDLGKKTTSMWVK